MECFPRYIVIGYRHKALSITVCAVSVFEPGKFSVRACEYQQFQFFGGSSGDDPDSYQYSYDNYCDRGAAHHDGVPFLPKVFREGNHDRSSEGIKQGELVLWGSRMAALEETSLQAS